MKVAKCPTCHQKGGFLTFRKIRKWTRPYVGHYDPVKYQKQKTDYEKGLRKSKPNGRKWCSITKYEAKSCDFENDWYDEYMRDIWRIYEKYKKFGFKDEKYARDHARGIALKQAREEFMTCPIWNDNWNQARNILKTNGYAKEFLDEKIRFDICRISNPKSLFPDDPILGFVLTD